MNSESEDAFFAFQELKEVQKEILLMYWSALKVGDLRDIHIEYGDFDPFKYVNQCEIGGESRTFDIELVKSGSIVKIHSQVIEFWHNADFKSLDNYKTLAHTIEDNESKLKILESISTSWEHSKNLSDQVYKDRILNFFKTISENRLFVVP